MLRTFVPRLTKLSYRPLAIDPLVEPAHAIVEAFNPGFGARHLAGHPDGRGLHWKRFKAQLDELGLSDAEQDEAVRGARAAFVFVREAVEAVMG